KAKIDDRKRAARVAQSIKIVESAVASDDFDFSRLFVGRKGRSRLVFKLADKSGLGPQRDDVIRPAAVRAARIAFQNHIGRASTVHVHSGQDNGECPVRLRKDGLARRVQYHGKADGRTRVVFAEDWPNQDLKAGNAFGSSPLSFFARRL